MGDWDCLEAPLSGFFHRHGAFVSRHPLPFLLFPALLTAALSLGFLHTRSITDATYLFTPTNAPSKYERQVWTPFRTLPFFLSRCSMTGFQGDPRQVASSSRQLHPGAGRHPGSGTSGASEPGPASCASSYGGHWA